MKGVALAVASVWVWVTLRAAADPTRNDTPTTLSAEYRVRIERLDAPDFGVRGGPAYTALSQRWLLNADARSPAGARMFMELSAAHESGRRPAARSFDQSRLDVAQAFVEVPLGPRAAGSDLRVGRQELDLGGNRLVSLRDGTTLKRTFDAIKLDFPLGRWRATLLSGRPVQNRANAFDDRGDKSERFSAATLGVSRVPEGVQLSLFCFDRSRAIEYTEQGSGEDRRHTLGLRYVRAGEQWDVMAQGAVQTGRFGNFSIRAGGFATEVGWHPDGPTGVRFGAGLGMGSGDRDLSDRTINTFDPLYPNLGAFSDAPLWYPSNQIALELNASRTLGRLVLRGDTVLLGRTSLDDAVYANPGRPLTFPNRTERLGAEIFEASARWRVDSHVELYASYVHALALNAVRRDGGRDADFGLIQLTARL